MIVVNIIFYVLVLALLACILYFTMKREPVVQYHVPEIDVGLKDMNAIIKRETLFQIIAWFTTRSNVKNMSDPSHTSVIISELKDPDKIQKKVSTITAVIVGNLSPAIIEQFKLVYNVNAYSSVIDAVTVYVTRQVLFYIRKLNSDITAMCELNKNATVDDILKIYTLSIEKEIYKDNRIEITVGDETEDSEVNND